MTAEGFAEFLRRLAELELTDAHRRAVTARSVVDHQQSYSIYFSDPYGHALEVTTYDYDETSALVATLIRQPDPLEKS